MKNKTTQILSGMTLAFGTSITNAKTNKDIKHCKIKNISTNKTAGMKTLIISLLFLLANYVSASEINVQGSEVGGDGMDQKSVSYKRGLLLNSFEFEFDKEDDPDNHLQQIGILETDPGKISAIFRDQWPGARLVPGSLVTKATQYSDTMKWNARFYPINNSRIVIGTAKGECVDGGVCRVTLDRPRGGFTFVIRGFYFKFPSDDRHIDQISVVEENGILTIGFNDKNNDDRFHYQVDYAFVPDILISSKSKSKMFNKARTEQFTKIPRGRAVIRGFHVSFNDPLKVTGGWTGGIDHHIRKIGVVLKGGNLHTTYRDSDGKDDFYWRVDWAVLRDSKFINLKAQTTPPSIKKDNTQRSGNWRGVATSPSFSKDIIKRPSSFAVTRRGVATTPPNRSKAVKRDHRKSSTDGKRTKTPSTGNRVPYGVATSPSITKGKIKRPLYPKTSPDKRGSPTAVRGIKVYPKPILDTTTVKTLRGVATSPSITGKSGSIPKRQYRTSIATKDKWKKARGGGVLIQQANGNKIYITSKKKVIIKNANGKVIRNSKFVKWSWGRKTSTSTRAFISKRERLQLRNSKLYLVSQ